MDSSFATFSFRQTLFSRLSRRKLKACTNTLQVSTGRGSMLLERWLDFISSKLVEQKTLLRWVRLWDRHCTGSIWRKRLTSKARMCQPFTSISQAYTLSAWLKTTKYTCWTDKTSKSSVFSNQVERAALMSLQKSRVSTWISCRFCSWETMQLFTWFVWAGTTRKCSH